MEKVAKNAVESTFRLTYCKCKIRFLSRNKGIKWYYGRCMIKYRYK
ncbi:hypothetical protein MOD48_05510 [Bacillus spizizenii]|uniref:Uncharacterized protein n=1 Tax=Bacillus spizizenii TaxID=96241 RepID=A0A9Q4DPZ6_BACSC|nr:hypothetical protein [Bacillus spizizenii]MCY7825357.1 hypothetical protein [Bacillus spizizenii]MCY7832803.1 hypothetical protein [Bacillus spizizenii]MCY7875302.1 hypothetical protein [Bacillus spizizenii]MCY7876033.1 hypothetical protein [Bacillus spizizenii]MCY7958452.1 hypothetical protein [Bacillus spizizenii]